MSKKKETTIENKKEASQTYANAYTWTSLQEILNTGKVVIGLNTFYKMYTENTDLRVGLRKIADKIGAKDLYFVDDDEAPVEKKGLKRAVKKIFTDEERGLKTFESWKRELIKDFYIAGEVFFLPIILWNGQLQNFQILDPRTITKVHDKEWRILEYKQKLPGGSWRTYPADKISYYKLENDPKNQVNGLSLLYSVTWDALTDNKASQRNFYFFENDKVPRAIVKLGKDFDYEDLNTKKRVNILQDGLNGTDKSNKTVVSNMIEDVKILEMTNKDMEFVQQRKLTTDKVCALLGVPKSQLWYVEDINYATAQQFYKDYIDGTIIPRQGEVSFILTDILRKHTSSFEGLNIVLETHEAIDIYKQHEDERADVVAGILEVNEVREERGYKPKKETPAPAPAKN